MTRLRYPAIVVAALAAAAIAGCGVGEGETAEGTADLRVTQDYGHELVLEASSTDPSEAETVSRFLDREADIETSYGGNFVEAINGIESQFDQGRTLDWYFYVNGNWSPIGAAEAKVRPNDRIWWDYRDWSSSYRVPAVVGSFPEPFRSGYAGERWPTQLVCLPSAGAEACDDAEAALADAGADLERANSPAQTDPDTDLRVLVGAWDEVREDGTARMMEGGPRESGVYSRPVACGDGYALEAFDAEGEEAGGSADAAWVAAVQRNDERPTWIVSATSAEGVPDAVGMLAEETLRDHYSAAAFDGAEPTALPAESEVGQGVSCP